MKDQFNAKWLALQGIAIVGSILLAFAIEAWWSESQEESDVSELLRILVSETDLNIQEVEYEIAFRKAKLTSAYTLLELATKGEPFGAGHSVIDGLINDIMWWGYTDFSRGALDSLIDGGKLSWVDPVSLRARISSWNRVLENVNRAEQQDFDRYQSRLLPFLSRHANLPQINNAGDGRPGIDRGFRNTAQPVAQKQHHVSLLKDQQFVSLLASTIWDQEDALDSYQYFLRRAGEIKEMLAASGY